MYKRIAIAFITLLAIGLLLLLISCKTVQKTSTDSSLLLIGSWKEYWGVGEVTNVEYNDLYDISIKEGIIKFTCQGRPAYRFEDISFNGRILQFVLINAKNPEDLYIMNYELELNPDGTKLTGKVNTNKGIVRNILWEKIN